MNDLLDFYTNAPLLELGAEADRMRRSEAPATASSRTSSTATSTTRTSASPTAASARSTGGRSTAKGYTLSFEQIGAKIDETKALGGVQILMQGGHNPYIPFEWYLDLLRYIKTHHPIHIHGFSPSEVDFFAKLFRMDARRRDPRAA